MRKIYKIYFDGDKVIDREMDSYHDQEFDTLFLSEDKDNFVITQSIRYGDLDKVSTYSLGDIIAYTFDKDKVDELSGLVEDKIKNYHNEQIFRKKKDIEKHEEVLYKLHFRMEYEE